MIAQNISEDNGGTSSIVMPVGNLSINTGDSKLKLGYVNGVPSGAAFLKRVDTTGFAVNASYLTTFDSVTLSNRFIVGAYIWGNNEEGLAELYNEGQITPGAGAEGILGFKFYPHGDNYFKRFKAIEDCAESLKNYADSSKKDIASFNQDLNLIMAMVSSLEMEHRKNAASIAALDTQFVDSLFKRVKYIVDNANVVFATSMVDSLRAYVARKNAETSTLSTQTKKVLMQILVVIDVSMKSSTTQLNRYKQNSLNCHNTILNHVMKIRSDGVDYGTFYLRGTIDKREFTLYQPTANTLSAKYLDSSFVGYSVSANFNYLMPKQHLIFGASIGYERFDNYSVLKSRKIETSTVVYSDSLRTDKLAKTITAVEGNYKFGFRIPLLFDVCYLVPVKKSDLIVAYGLYARFNQVTVASNPELYDDWKFGVSINLLQKTKSKYIVGAYIQTGNANGGKGKKDDFGETVSAGLTLKLNLRTFDYNRVFY